MADSNYPSVTVPPVAPLCGWWEWRGGVVNGQFVGGWYWVSYGVSHCG